MISGAGREGTPNSCCEPTYLINLKCHIKDIMRFFLVASLSNFFTVVVVVFVSCLQPGVLFGPQQQDQKFQLLQYAVQDQRTTVNH